MLKIILDTADSFHAIDPGDRTFYIEGHLTNGSLTFTVVAERGGQRSAFAGHEFFAEVMAHFGDRVERISAVWTDASPGLRTNLDTFNAETRRGASKEEAAFRTKTGKWARAYGYTLIQGDITTTPGDFPGGYEQVLVDFIKPQS